MSTADHQWLATAFIPQWVIDKEYSPPAVQNVIGGYEHLIAAEEPYSPPANSDTVEPKKFEVGKADYAGYTVVVNDAEQGIVISEIEEDGELCSFRGKAMLVDDPSRVYLGTTPYKHQEGLRIKAMMSEYGAVAGINASSFNDPGDEGHGGDIIGRSCSEGEFWGVPVNSYGAILLTENNRLVVGNVTDWEQYAIRDGMQFGPVLIADGVAQFTGATPGDGYGIHPRTAIGQCADGTIVFLVIDGRQPLWSTGCTVKDMIDVLMKYGVVNAACCDGGSSSVMAYNGEVITKNSSKNPDYGRRLPNAWLVRPKESTEGNADE